MSHTPAAPALRHAIHWFEIPVSDMARSQRFYEQLLGVQLRVEHMGPNQLAVFPYTQPGVGGALMKVDQVTPGQQTPLLYLNAGDHLQTVLDRVASLGGTTVLPRTELPPGMGCFAHITAPDGQRVGLHALD